MTINEYQKLALRTNPVKNNRSFQGILHRLPMRLDTTLRLYCR